MYQQRGLQFHSFYFGIPLIGHHLGLGRNLMHSGFKLRRCMAGNTAAQGDVTTVSSTIQIAAPAAARDCADGISESPHDGWRRQFKRELACFLWQWSVRGLVFSPFEDDIDNYTHLSLTS